MVLVSVRRNSVVLHDPAQGRRTLSLAEVSQSFTGVALEAWPGSAFEAYTVSNRLSLGSLMRSVHGLKGTLARSLSVIGDRNHQPGDAGRYATGDGSCDPCRGSRSAYFDLCRVAIFHPAAGGSQHGARLVLIGHGNSHQRTVAIWLFNHLLRLPLGYFERRKLGDIQSRFGSLDALRSTFTASIVGAIMDSIMVIGVLVMMILYGGWLTWIVMAFTTLYVLLRLLTYGYYRQLSEESLVRSARPARISWRHCMA
ncbi:Lactococcin-G-processing and transport ATP-binding protein LagD [Serratia plymuthica]|uniref:Lactococcin-G-processing and transport ATP-binding protein LagD n=1 Tax=Serratia plymuthica TaxID=82996 RepID=A0A2X4VE96_SERPL|nr:Lactococcin-G-processing and transport ATP-binding protein LagD [Serratia plymuthica]